MNKGKAAVCYQCSTKIKAMGIFYLIQYSITALIFAIVALSVGEGVTGSNGLEFSSLVFVSIMGILGYLEDFKALIQNGYTRRVIYLSTLGMFLFMAAVMAFIDTVVGNLLHFFFPGYFAIFGALYGYGNVLLNWLWLTALYLSFCCLFYLAVLLIRRLGKTAALLTGVGLGGGVLLLVALFRFVFSPEIGAAVGRFFLGSMGFLANGTVNPLFPVLSFLLLGGLLAAGAYALICRAEVR